MAFGQVNISGIITDKKDHCAIKNAKISLYTQSDSLIESLKTDKKGYYKFKETGPGEFYLKVEKKKYSTTIIKDIKVPLAHENIDITLERYFDIGLVH